MPSQPRWRTVTCPQPGSRLLAAAGAVVAVLLCTIPAFADELANEVRRLADGGTHPWLRRSRFPEHQADVQAAYAPGGFLPIWVRGGKPTPQATAIIAALGEADRHGLAAADYDAERLEAERHRLADASQPAVHDVALFDVATTVSVMRFASDSHRGRIDPRGVGFELAVERKTMDLPRIARELAQDSAPAERLAELEPGFTVYGRLEEALARVRALAARTDLPAVPALPKLRPGDTHPAMPALRQRLTALGDLAEGTPVPHDPTLYDPALATAVQNFQRRHGLDPDGVIGAATLRQLQTPLADRVKQVQLAMERLRWLPAQFPERFLTVNIPEYRLRCYEHGQRTPQLAMNIVVGSSARKTQTPVLFADMRYVIFQPYWNVPPGITREEILPRLRREPGYLAREKMDIIASGKALPQTPDSIAQLTSGGARLRQRPGPHNALGLLKFIFPNPKHVYLHDTPSKGLFKRSRRDFSHGCIRVQDPVGLAEFVLRGQDSWDRQRIVQTMNDETPGHTDRRVDLRSPVAVYLFYTTVVEENGTLYFLDDIYGHDAKLARLLEQR